MRAALQALLFLAPLVLLPGLFDPANLPQTALVQVAGGALLAVALAAGLRVTPPWRISAGGLPFSLLVGLGGLSIFWAHTFREAWPEALRWLSVAVVLCLAAALCTDEGAARRLLGALFSAAAAATVLGLAQFYFRVSWVPQAFPPAATFMNRNVAVSFIVGAWPLAFALAGRRGSARSWAVAALCGLMAAFLFHTFTKSGWLALLGQLAMVLFLWATRPHEGRARAWWPGVVTAAAVMATLAHFTPQGLRPRWQEAATAVAFTFTAPLAGPDRPLVELTPDDRANSIRSRRAIWMNTAVMVRDYPLLGVGLGNHKVHYPRYARRAAVDPAFGPAQLDYVHDEPLQLLAELGGVGFLLGAWLLASVARAAWRAHRAGRHPSLVLAIVVSLAGIAIDGLFNFPFERAIPPVLAVVELAVLAFILREPQEATPQQAARPAARGLALLAAAATLAVAIVQGRVLAADHHVLEAREAEARHDWGQAELSASRALRQDPARKEALFVRGRALLEEGDARAAAAVLERLLASHPDDVAALGNLAAAERAQGHAREAKAILLHLLELWPEDARAHAVLARTLETEGDLRGAVAQYAQAAALDPKSADHAFGQGVDALRLHDLATAEGALREAVRRDPRSARALKALGVTLLEQGRREEAREEMRRALELDPGLPDAARMQVLIDENPVSGASPRP